MLCTTDISFSELTELGYYHGPVDGQIGPETERAIRSFQSVDKLSVTGQIDGATLKALGSRE
jgi:peptidoglycan hydrolase-like protein with peptidoglycan-binding domain